MNDLMPPDRRPMPGDRSQTMRTFLQDEADPVRPPRRRPWVPVAVAAAVAAIVVGGYVTATQIGDDGRPGTEQQPAGSPNADPTVEPTVEPTAEPTVEPTAEPTVEPTQDPKPDDSVEQGGIPQGDPSLNLLTEGQGPDDAEQRCIDAIEEASYDVPTDVTARVVNKSAEMTTVVISNGEFTRTCNVDPDSAVSNAPGEALVDGGWKERLFGYAANVNSNYDMGHGELAWAGGPLPEGIESVTYVFADGGEVEALVDNGFWVMQYLTKADVQGKAYVVLEGSDGTEVLQYAPYERCNQISHGC